MKIVWTDFAIRNLKAIFDYYSSKANKKVAHKIREQILESTKRLTDIPNSGPVEPNLLILNKGHRYLVSGNYKVIYRIVANEIVINDIFDTRQNPPKMNDEKRMSE